MFGGELEREGSYDWGPITDDTPVTEPLDCNMLGEQPGQDGTGTSAVDTGTVFSQTSPLAGQTLAPVSEVPDGVSQMPTVLKPTSGPAPMEVDEPQQIPITPMILPSAPTAIIRGGAVLAPGAIRPQVSSRSPATKLAAKPVSAPRFHSEHRSYDGGGGRGHSPAEHPTCREISDCCTVSPSSGCVSISSGQRPSDSDSDATRCQVSAPGPSSRAASAWHTLSAYT